MARRLLQNESALKTGSSDDLPVTGDLVGVEGDNAPLDDPAARRRLEGRAAPTVKGLLPDALI